jgi:hypothetical protein
MGGGKVPLPFHFKPRVMNMPDIDGFWDRATIMRQATEITRLKHEAQVYAEKLEQANQKIHDLQNDLKYAKGGS